MLYQSTLLVTLALLSGCTADGTGRFIDARLKGTIDYALQKHAGPALCAAGESLQRSGDMKASAAVLALAAELQETRPASTPQPEEPTREPERSVLRSYRASYEAHLADGAPLAVLVTGPGCPACREMARAIYSEFIWWGDVHFYEVDTEKEWPLAQALMKSNSIPQFIVWHKGQQPIRLIGEKSIEEIQAALDGTAEPDLLRALTKSSPPAAVCPCGCGKNGCTCGKAKQDACQTSGPTLRVRRRR